MRRRLARLHHASGSWGGWRWLYWLAVPWLALAASAAARDSRILWAAGASAAALVALLVVPLQLALALAPLVGVSGEGESPVPVFTAPDEDDELGPTPSPTPSPNASGGTVPPSPSPTPSSSRSSRAAEAGDLPSGEETAVARIVDGDTIEVADGTRVRLIGMDTPEVHGGVECLGREASAHIERLIPSGTEIRLEYDVERTDRYGRTLAYVWRSRDALHVNEEMVRAGYAQVATYPPNVRYADRFLAAQRSAREDERGLWSSCSDGDAAGGGTASGSSRPGAGGQGSGTGGWSSGSCHPAYQPCVPPPSETGDLDCADIRRHHRGGVTVDHQHGDPHRLDGDGDGRGCE